MHFFNGFSESAGKLEIWLAGFAPNQVGVWREGNPSGNRQLESSAEPEKAFFGSFSGAEGLIALVEITGQELGRFGIGPGDQNRWHTGHVGRQARGGEL